MQSVCSEARRECGVGAVPRLRARRTASTFHRRKVDRKAAGGPLYPRRRVPASDFRQFICRKSMKFPGDPAKPVLRGNRNAPRNPPFADSEDGFCCIPSPRPSRGLAPLCKGSWQGRQALTEGLWVAYRSGLTVTGCFLLHRAYNPSGSHPFATSPYTGEPSPAGVPAEGAKP